MKKWISWILAIGTILVLAIPSAFATEKPVTRIDWVKQLVETFDMTVEEDNYPDNYYSDMDESSSGYRDLLVAVEFGVIDLEAGSAFEPEQPATREFAAYTLNFCLGFQLDEGAAYTYAESAAVSYPDDLQVAANRGWFALSDGKILPQQTLTSTEAAAMLKDAKAVRAGDKIDVDHNNSFTYVSGVVEIPETTPVEIREDGTVTVVNLPASVKAGTTFVVYQDGFPRGFKAVSIQKNGQTSVITAEKVALGSILSSADAEGRVQSDLTDFEPADGVEIAYIFADGTETTSRTQAARITKKIKDIVLKKTISGVTVSATLSHLSMDYGLSGGQNLPVSARAILNGKASISSTIPFSAPVSIELGYIPVGFFGSITVTADIGVDGTITLSYGCDFSMGVSYSSREGFRAIMEFSKESFSLAANFNVHAGLKIAANITNLDFIYGTIYAKIGVQCNYTVVSHSEPEYPDLCVGTDAWLYANAGLDVGVSCWKIDVSYSKKLDIWNRKNSPVRSVSHFEDNVLVPACTCDTTGVFGKYFTRSSSRYFNDGRSSVVNMPTYTYDLDDDGNATITGYSGNVAALSIPSTIDGHTVVAIGNGAFEENTALAAVVIPDSVTSIQADAFRYCTGLTSVKLPSAIQFLGSDAFSGCTGLTSIFIPKTITEAGIYGPFSDCTNLQSVEFEQGITRIPDCLFRDCRGKIKTVLPDSVTEVGWNAFGESGLISIELSKNITLLESMAFYNCTELTSIFIPKAITEAGTSGPFSECINLQSVEFEQGITRIPDCLFRDCGGKIRTVLPDSVTEIGWCAFCDSGLTSVTIPDSVTSIERSAFSGCPELLSVDLPNNLRELGAYAFYNCTGLTSVFIPKTVVEAGNGSPFIGCTNLKSFEFEQGMKRIPDCILDGCNAELNIIIPNGVTEIGWLAFRDSGITSVSIPDTVTEIENGVFGDCVNLTTIKIPDSVTDMGDAIFSGCTSLTDVTLPNCRKNIPSSTFEGCTALEKIVLPETVTAIWNSAFENCTALKEIVWSKAPKIIASDAFHNCDGLTKITVPDSVTELGDAVFYDCDALKDVKLGTGITTIPASTFQHCDVLEQLTVPRRVTEIEEYAFKDCVKLSSIFIPRSVTEIDSSAFSYPEKLTISGVAGTYAETFANDNGIKFESRQISATAARLDQTEVTMLNGEELQLHLSVTPEDFTDVVAWKSSNTDVVKVSENGLITAEGPGTATVKVTVGGVSVSCKVTVTQPVTSIWLDESDLTLNARETYQLYASVYPDSAADSRLEWSSSDTSVATVDENGLVTALKKGTAVITVAAADGSGVKSQCTVTVRNTVYICTSAQQMESSHNYPDNCSDIWEYTIPGAASLSVTFDARTELEDGYDYLHIYDENNELVKSYTGSELAGQTINVPGSVVRLKLVSDGSGNSWGFKVTNITAGEVHKLTAHAAVAATCTKAGSSNYWSCSTCGKFFSDAQGKNEITKNSWVIKALGHASVKDAAKAATCTKTGLTEGSHCSRCDAVLKAQTKTAALGHSYKNGACTRCGAKDPNYKPAAPTVKSEYQTVSGKPYLKWAAVSGAAKYEVYRSGSRSGTYKLLGTTTKTNYTDTTASAGYTYYYKVKTVNKNGVKSNSSAAVSAISHCAKPVVKAEYTVSSGKPYLKWSAVTGASKYQVYRAGSQNGTYKLLGTTTKTNYTDTTASAGYTYYYKVKVVSKVKTAANSAYSTAAKAICHCAKPVAKSDYLTSTGKPYVKWSAVIGAGKYYVYRAGSQNGTYKYIGSTTKTNYTDTTASAGYAYYYKVKAVSKVKAAANSAYSTVVKATCHCAKPVVKITTSSGKPKLTWNAVAGAGKYEVYRATSKNGTYTKMFTTTNRSYTNTNARPGTTYYYKVKAISRVRSTANSSFSAIKSIRAR